MAPVTLHVVALLANGMGWWEKINIGFQSLLLHRAFLRLINY
jgi:hypothetical protein